MGRRRQRALWGCQEEQQEGVNPCVAATRRGCLALAVMIAATLSLACLTDLAVLALQWDERAENEHTRRDETQVDELPVAVRCCPQLCNRCRLASLCQFVDAHISVLMLPRSTSSPLRSSQSVSQSVTAPRASNHLQRCSPQGWVARNLSTFYILHSTHPVFIFFIFCFCFFLLFALFFLLLCFALILPFLPFFLRPFIFFTFYLYTYIPL